MCVCGEGRGGRVVRVHKRMERTRGGEEGCVANLSDCIY